MRVIGGTLRSRKIKSPKGEEARPTSDRVRETLFSVIQSDVEGSCVLDLFAGPGTLGIEAISRGASFVTFVEMSPDVAKVLEANIEGLGIEEKSLVRREDGLKVLRDMTADNSTFGLIFMDPPYSAGLAGEALRLIAEGGIVAEDGLVVVEHSKEDSLGDPGGGLLVVRVLDFGGTHVAIYRREGCAR